jgi:hypothetical protein
MSQQSAPLEGQTILEHINELRIYLTRAVIGLAGYGRQLCLCPAGVGIPDRALWRSA